MRSILCTAALLTSLVPSANASLVELYSEDFSGQAGKGYFAGSTDVSGVTTWTLNTAGINPSATFGVNGSEQFTAVNVVDATVFFTTDIDISGYTGVSFSLDAFNLGGLEAADYFDVRYRVDSDPIVLVQDWMGLGSSSHTLTGNGSGAGWASGATISQSVPDGDNLKLTITIKNDDLGGLAETIGFDNIVVTAVAIPEPASALFFGLPGVAAVLLARRRGRRD